MYSEYFDDSKVGVCNPTAMHQAKFGIVKDGFNKWWQEIVNLKKWMTADESCVARWYKSMMTCGPEPKPIRTGVTVHTLCATKGPLKMYNKLFA